MKTGYLTWVKDLDERIDKLENIYDFTGSAVYEPDILPYLSWPKLRKRLQRPNYWGHPNLIAAIGKRYGIGKANGRPDRDRILLTNGASVAIWLVCRALLQASDHVVVEWPVYEPLLAAPDSLGAR